MWDKFLNAVITARKNAYLKLVLVMLAIVAVGFSTVSQYGYSVDEGTEVSMVRRNFELITKGQPIPGDLKYFGTVFNFTAETVFQIKQYIQKGPSYNPAKYQGEANDEELKLKALSERIKVKHVLTFLASLIAYLSVAGIVAIFCGAEWAWFGPVVLALFPIFWGHSLFNPKDIPFASMFILCSYAGSYLLADYLTVDTPVGIGLNRTNIYSLGYGTLAGLLTSIRIGGFFLLFFIGMTGAVLFFTARRNIYKSFYNLGIPYVLMFLAWGATTIIWQPASWSNPIGWFLETIQYLSKHPLPISVLFEGRVIPIQEIPIHYIPKLMFMTIPLIFQLALWAGIILIAVRYPKLSNLQRACFCLVALQVFFIPLVAIVKHSSVYDGIRHFMFSITGIAAIAAIALIWIYEKLPKPKSWRIFGAALIVTVFSSIAFDMVALHPYQYIYFNRISGGLAYAHNRYETEYWGLSLREGMEWINLNAKPGDKVFVGGSFYSAKLYADPRLNVMEYDSPQGKNVSDKPFYYLAWPRWKAQDEFPECKVVHQVVRQNVPLSIVKLCK